MHTQQRVTLMIIQNELTVFKLHSSLKDFVVYYAATFYCHDVAMVGLSMVAFSCVSLNTARIAEVST